MTIEEWERAAAAAVPVLAILLAPVGAIVVAVVSGRATKRAAHIARDQDREADARRRRVDAYQALAGVLQEAIEKFDRWGGLGLTAALADQTRTPGSSAYSRDADVRRRAGDTVDKAERQAHEVWRALPTEESVRERMLAVELVGPWSVITTAREYVDLVAGLRFEAAESGLRSGVVSDTLTAPRVVELRGAMFEAMRRATLHDMEIDRASRWGRFRDTWAALTRSAPARTPLSSVLERGETPS